MLNVLIIKEREFGRTFFDYFDWKTHGVSKLITTNDMSKICFDNLQDIDFVFIDSDTIIRNEFALLDKLHEKGLCNRLVLVGKVNDEEKLSYIIKTGVKCYLYDYDKVDQIVAELFKERVVEKELYNKFILSLHDGSVVKKVRQALEKGDSRQIHKLIFNGLKNLPMPEFLIKEYFLLILKIVFEFAEEKGVRHIEKKEVIAEIVEKTTFEILKDAALKKINSIIHLVEVNKNNQNKKMVAAYIKDFIDENYMKQDTNAGNIAERFGGSGSYVGMLFREQQKTTITKYITKLRIDKASELLSETKLQIQVISKKVGYSDQNYFARIFKKQTGLSPGEYRNKCSH